MNSPKLPLVFALGYVHLRDVPVAKIFYRWDYVDGALAGTVAHIKEKSSPNMLISWES